MIDFFRLALKSIKEKRTRSWLTLLGIFIGIATVVALIGLGDGLKLAISSQFGISSTEVLSVQAGGISAAGPPGTAVVTPLTFEDSDEIEKLSLVEYSIPRILQTGKLEFDDNLIFGFIMSVPDGDKRDYAYEVLSVSAEFGRLLKDGDKDKVVLGYNFYNSKVGLDKPILVGNTIIIQDKNFEVVGIVEKKGSFIFDNIVYMNEDVLIELFDRDNSVNIIAVKAKNSKVVEEAKEDIEKLMRKRRDVKVGDEDFSVQTPQSALETVNTVLTGVQIFVIMIAAISIFVGSLGIVNTMLTSVLERKKQIGTMKAIGAKNSDIFFIFFFESGLMGLVGGAIGVFIGTFISYIGTKGINNFIGAEIGVSLNFTLIIGALLGSFLIGSIAGIVPALRAAKENPVEAMRG